MRILVLTVNVPRFPASGSPSRTWNLLRELADRHELRLVSAAPRGEEPEGLREVFREVRLVPPSGNGAVARGRLARLLGPPARVRLLEPYRKGVARELERLEGRFRPDVIHVEHTLTTLLLGGRFPQVPRVVDAPDVVHRLYAWWADLAGSTRERLRHLLEVRKLRRLEREIYRKAAHLVVVSRRELEVVREMAPATPATMVENGVDPRYFTPSPDPPDPSRLVFTGKMDYAPNLDAALFMAEAILPRLRRVRRGIEFHVVGMDPPPPLQVLDGTDGIRVWGAVPDVRPHLARAAVVVVPLRAGSGTRLKILEALAAGKPVVSTRLGAEGLEVEDGRHLLLADTAEEFAERVLALLDSEALRNRLGEAGRRRVEEHYDWKALAPRLEQVYRAAAGR